MSSSVRPGRDLTVDKGSLLKLLADQGAESEVGARTSSGSSAGVFDL